MSFPSLDAQTRLGLLDRFARQTIGQVNFNNIEKKTDQLDVLDLGVEAAFALIFATIQVVQELSLDVNIRNEKLAELEAIAEDLRNIRDAPNITQVHDRLQDGEAVRFAWEGQEFYLYSPSREDYDQARHDGVWGLNVDIRRGSDSDEHSHTQLYALTGPELANNLNPDGTVFRPFGDTPSTGNEAQSRLLSRWVESNLDRGREHKENAAPTGFYEISHAEIVQNSTEFASQIGEGNSLYLSSPSREDGSDAPLYAFLGPSGLEKDDASQITGVQTAIDTNTDEKSELSRYNQTTTTILQNLTQVLTSLQRLVEAIDTGIKDTGRAIANNT